MRPCWRSIDLRSSLLTFILLLVSVAAASAQTVTGAIVGKVFDPSGLPLPGVTVTLESPQLIGGPRVSATSTTGEYRFPSLSPGTYTVTMEMTSFKTVRNEGVVVRAGSTMTVDAQLDLATVEETVTVTGESPIIDVKSSQTRETYSQELIQNVPTSRAYVDIYHLLPGVEDGMYRELTPGASSINGGTNQDNRMNLEGANLNDSLVTNVASDISYEIVEEVQVVTSGINAEFGGASAGVVNVLTKSGGNAFSGSGYVYYSGDSLQGTNITPELKAQGVATGTTVEKDFNGGATFGGPLRKDRLWFFGNYDRKSEDRTIIDYPTLVTGRQNMYFGKLSAALSEKHRLNGFYQYRFRNDYPFIPQAIERGEEVLRTQDHTNHIVYFGWTGTLSANTAIEAKGNISNQKRFQDFPNAQEGSIGYVDQSTREIRGPWYRDVVHPGSRNTREVKADLSHYRPNLGGSHDFKFGGTYDYLYVDELREWKNGARAHQLFNGQPYRIVLSNNPVTLRGNVGTTSFYAQDQWSISSRLTVNLGVRFENHDVWIPEGFTGGVNFERQNFPREDLVSVNTVSPRLGLTFDLLGDHKTIIKAAFGRYYEQLYASPFTSVAKFAQGSRTFDWIDRNGDLVYQPGEEGRLVNDTTRLDLASVDPNLRVPYWNTFAIGVERELGKDVKLGVTGIFRKGFDEIEEINRARPFDTAYIPVTLTNPLTGQPITVYPLNPAFRSVPAETFITNPGADLCSFCQDIVQQYKGLQITFEKRMRNRWQFYGSYVLSSAEGNKGTHHRTSQGNVYSNPNNLVNAFGKTTLDRTHSFKAQASYQAPYEIWLSTSYYGQTGVPFQRDRGVLGPLVRFVRADTPLMVVEANIDVLGLTPGEVRQNARHLLDFRVEKRFGLAGTRFLGVIFDVRNLFNGSYADFMQEVRLGGRGYDVPGSLVLPRTVRLGARLVF